MIVSGRDFDSCKRYLNISANRNTSPSIGICSFSFISLTKSLHSSSSDFLATKKYNKSSTSSYALSNNDVFPLRLLPVTIVKRAVCNDRLRMLCNSAISSFLPKNLIFQVDYTTIILFYFRNLHFGNSGFECKDKEKLLTIKAFSLVMNKILAAHDTNNPMNSLRRDGSPPLPLPGCHCSRHTSR